MRLESLAVVLVQHHHLQQFAGSFFKKIKKYLINKVSKHRKCQFTGIPHPSQQRHQLTPVADSETKSVAPSVESIEGQFRLGVE